MKDNSVLFVDDDEDLRAFVKSVLEAEGYHVVTAGVVSEGLKIAFNDFPSLVITDVMMPNESGYSLCTKLRSDASTKNIPIIVVTVLDDEIQALEAGATAFLAKPLNAKALVSLVKELLKPQSAFVARLNDVLGQLRERHIPEARKGLWELLTSDPDNALAKWAHYYLGQIEQYENNDQEAVSRFKTVLEKDPEFWRAHNRLGMIYKKSGNIAQAIRHYKRSLALNPDQPDVQGVLESLPQQD